MVAACGSLVIGVHDNVPHWRERVFCDMLAQSCLAGNVWLTEVPTHWRTSKQLNSQSDKKSITSLLHSDASLCSFSFWLLLTAHLSHAASISPEDLCPLAMLLTVSLKSAKASKYLAVPSPADAVAAASPPKPSWSGAAVEMPKTLRMRVAYAAAFLTRKG